MASVRQPLVESPRYLLAALTQEELAPMLIFDTKSRHNLLLSHYSSLVSIGFQEHDPDYCLYAAKCFIDLQSEGCTSFALPETTVNAVKKNAAGIQEVNKKIIDAVVTGGSPMHVMNFRDWCYELFETIL